MCVIKCVIVLQNRINKSVIGRPYRENVVLGLRRTTKNRVNIITIRAKRLKHKKHGVKCFI